MYIVGRALDEKCSLRCESFEPGARLGFNVDAQAGLGHESRGGAARSLQGVGRMNVLSPPLPPPSPLTAT